MPKPLEGVRIVDLSQLTSGPLATMMLAEQGADVVKIEPPGLGDVFRLSSFFRNGFSALLLNHTRGKRSICVDTATAEGRALVVELMAGADVVVQNFRPGVVDRLGFGYEAIKAVNPAVVYVSVSGFGPTGPYANRPSSTRSSKRSPASWPASRARPSRSPTSCATSSSTRPPR